MKRPTAVALERALIEAVETLNILRAQSDSSRGITDRANCMAALAGASIRNISEMTGGYVREFTPEGTA